MPVRTSIKLTITILSLSLIGCKHPITAEDAITIGRNACEARLKNLISQAQSGKTYPSPKIAPTDWKASRDGRDWIVLANDFAYYFSVVVTASGKPSECTLRHMDA